MYCKIVAVWKLGVYLYFGQLGIISCCRICVVECHVLWLMKGWSRCNNGLFERAQKLVHQFDSWCFWLKLVKVWIQRIIYLVPVQQQLGKLFDNRCSSGTGHVKSPQNCLALFLENQLWSCCLMEANSWSWYPTILLFQYSYAKSQILLRH